ncbi:hypothetical protein ABK559_004668, partial [Escherichia coli]
PDTVLDHRERVRLFIQIQFPHGSDWSEVLRLTDIVTEKVSSGRAAGGYHHRHTGYTWSVSHIILFCPVPDFPGVSS